MAILDELAPLVTRNVVRWLKLPQTGYSLNPLVILALPIEPK